MEALQKLHDLGPRIVIITSTDFAQADGDEIFLYASQLGKGESDVNHSNVLKVGIPVLKT